MVVGAGPASGPCATESHVRVCPGTTRPWTTSREGTRIPDDTIGNMMAGRSQTLRDVATLIANEEVVKDECDKPPPLFEVARTFGGDEVVEYPRSR